MLLRVLLLWEFDRTTLSRGSKSRNKVSVGEPAEGSLKNIELIFCKPNLRISTCCFRETVNASSLWRCF